MNKENVKERIRQKLNFGGSRSVDYSEGQVVEWESRTGHETQTVIVDNKTSDITTDPDRGPEPGFDGEFVERDGSGWSRTGRGVWGYDNQVNRVVDRNPGPV